MSTHGEIISIGDAVATLATLMKAYPDSEMGMRYFPDGEYWVVELCFDRLTPARRYSQGASTLLRALEGIIDEVQAT